MPDHTLQFAAQAAFSREDWTVLQNDSTVWQRFLELRSIEDVERFIFDASDYLRPHREQRLHGMMSGAR